MMKKIIILLAVLLSTYHMFGQDTVSVVRVNQQRTFPNNIPAGNYSAITYLGDSLYAVVSDKSPHDGFFLFKITLDSLTADIQDVQNLGFKADDAINGDLEGIVYVPTSQTFFISRESDNTVHEYAMDGKRTPRQLNIPAVYHRAAANEGLESLAYQEKTQTFWTCNESTLKGDGEQTTAENGVQNRLRLQSFGPNLEPLHQYAYLMDKPEATRKAWVYSDDVSEITALRDSSLLFLEREFYVPSSKLGAFVSNKLYRVRPNLSLPVEQDAVLTTNSPYLDKHLITQWRTKLSLFNHEIANYEGMCLGPTLNNGSQVIILVSDSQDQFGGVLKDWFKTIVLK